MSDGDMFVKMWLVIQENHPHVYNVVKCTKKAYALGYTIQVEVGYSERGASNLAVLWHMHENDMLIGKVSVVPPEGLDASVCFTRVEDAVAFKLLRFSPHLEGKLEEAADRLFQRELEERNLTQ